MALRELLPEIYYAVWYVLASFPLL
jgi:hypothetical protein